jgi:hypothetical protein
MMVNYHLYFYRLWNHLHLKNLLHHYLFVD